MSERKQDRKENIHKKAIALEPNIWGYQHSQIMLIDYAGGIITRVVVVIAIVIVIVTICHRVNFNIYIATYSIFSIVVVNVDVAAVIMFCRVLSNIITIYVHLCCSL